MNIERKKINIGKYHVSGPLLPGEEDTSDLTKKIRKILMNLRLIQSRKEDKVIEQDDRGNPYLPIFYDLTKRTIEFEIMVKMSYDIDFKIRKGRRFTISRIFSVELIEEFAPPNSAFDLYKTDIRMKSGWWS